MRFRSNVFSIKCSRSDNTGSQWQRKNWGGHVTVISDKSFNFDEFILF